MISAICVFESFGVELKRDDILLRLRNLPHGLRHRRQVLRMRISPSTTPTRRDRLQHIGVDQRFPLYFARG